MEIIEDGLWSIDDCRQKQTKPPTNLQNNEGYEVEDTKTITNLILCLTWIFVVNNSSMGCCGGLVVAMDFFICIQKNYSFKNTLHLVGFIRKWCNQIIYDLVDLVECLWLLAFEWKWSRLLSLKVCFDLLNKCVVEWLVEIHVGTNKLFFYNQF